MRAEVLASTTYLLAWAKEVFTSSLLAKGLLAGLVMFIQRATQPIVFFVILAWAMDFLLGILRASHDPAVRLDRAKAFRGMARLLAIPLIAIMAAVVESATLATVGWDPAGKLVTAVAVAMFWQETVSAQGHARYFYGKLRFRIPKDVQLPWVEDDEEKPEEPVET